MYKRQTTKCPLQIIAEAGNGLKNALREADPGSHLRMCKAEATNPVLAALDASQRSMGCATGFSFPRWQQGLDVQLLKRSGKIGATSLRTVSCTEPDQNMNNKKIGRDAMWNGERAKALAWDNLGGRKGMQAAEVNQNWTLANDHIRGRRAGAVIISNDAKGCFDRIAHVVAIAASAVLAFPGRPQCPLSQPFNRCNAASGKPSENRSNPAAVTPVALLPKVSFKGTALPQQPGQP